MVMLMVMVIIMIINSNSDGNASFVPISKTFDRGGNTLIILL